MEKKTFLSSFHILKLLISAKSFKNILGLVLYLLGVVFNSTKHALLKVINDSGLFVIICWISVQHYTTNHDVLLMLCKSDMMCHRALSWDHFCLLYICSLDVIYHCYANSAQPYIPVSCESDSVRKPLGCFVINAGLSKTSFS